MPNRAVFFDRDDTLLEDSGFITHPDQVKLLPQAAEALRRIRACGYQLIVVSNQSGVARGLFDETQLAKVHERLRELLGAEGVTLDGIYYCPYLDGDEAVVEPYRRDSDWRKPQPGMLLAAARERDLDLAGSWMLGDRVTDIQAGEAARCRTILVHPQGRAYNGVVQPDYTVASLMEAAEIVERHSDTRAERPLEREEESSREVLMQIRDALERQERRARQDDFSFVRLIGVLLQMLAVAAALWGVAGLFGGQQVEAIPRMGLALFLQLLVLTIYVATRR